MATADSDTPASGEGRAPAIRSSIANALPDFAGQLEKPAFWWTFNLVVAAVFTLASVHQMNPDGLSYLDMASEARNSGLSSLVNPHWSPGLPALLAAAMIILRPSPEFEFPVVHLVIFLTFLLALSAFHYFIRSYDVAIRPASRSPSTYDAVIFGYASFTLITVKFIGLRVVTPDLLMCSSVFLVTGVCCRLYTRRASSRFFLLLGLVLAVGYYAKAPMFPLAILLLVLLWVFPPEGLNLRSLLFTAAVFLLLSAPLIRLVGAKVGRPSIGESAVDTYLLELNGLSAGWAHYPETRFGVPIHPPRKLMDRPMILEFASPVPGTYPLWYDPAYWWAGLKPVFSVSDQVRALVKAAKLYWRSSQVLVVVIGGALCLAMLAIPLGTPLRCRRLDVVLVLWAIAPLAMFATLHVESRYIASFVIVLFVILYSQLGARLPFQISRAIYLCVAITVITSLGFELPRQGLTAFRVLCGVETSSNLRIARGLQALGVRRGDLLSTVGRGIDAYYARLLGSRVIAQVCLDAKDPAPKAEDWERVRAVLAKIGVRALVSRGVPPGAAVENWEALSDGYVAMVLLPADSGTRASVGAPGGGAACRARQLRRAGRGNIL